MLVTSLGSSAASRRFLAIVRRDQPRNFRSACIGFIGYPPMPFSLLRSRFMIMGSLGQITPESTHDHGVGPAGRRSVCRMYRSSRPERE